MLAIVPMRTFAKTVRRAMELADVKQADLLRAVKTTRGKAYPKGNLSKMLKGDPHYDSVPYEVAEQIAAKLGDYRDDILDAWCGDRLPGPVWRELRELRARPATAPANGAHGPAYEAALAAFRELAEDMDETRDLPALAAFLEALRDAPWEATVNWLHRAIQQGKAAHAAACAVPPLPTGPLPAGPDARGRKAGA